MDVDSTGALVRSGAHPRLAVVCSAPAPDRSVEIVRGLLAGQPWAAMEMFDAYALDVRRVLTRMLGVDAELNDLLHDVFVQALEGIERLREPQRLRAWLIGICVHVARGRIRKRRRCWWMILLAGDSELAAATYRVLDRLEPEDRIVLALRVLEGLEMNEVAAACGVSRSTAKRRVAHAQARFRELSEAEPALREWAEGGEA
jgi:RNA polymerase sigma-70 factor (ECF subfamily)